MPDGNPLVATAKDDTTAATGIGIAESSMDLANGISNGDWVEAGLGAVGVGLEVLSMVIDPIGTIASYGVSWLIEHVRPLKEALDWFAGDPPVIRSFSETWANVAAEVNKVAADYVNEVKTGTAGWSGQSADTYRGKGTETADAVAGAGVLADGISAGVMIMGEVVAAVRELVRDLVAEVVGKLITWALEAVATLGLGTPVIVAQATAAISKVVNKIADLVRKLVKTIGNVTPRIRKVIDKLDEIIAKLGKLGRKGDAPGTPGSSTTPDGFSSPDSGTSPAGTTSPSGTTSPDGTSPSSATTKPDGSPASPDTKPDGPGTSGPDTGPGGRTRTSGDSGKSIKDGGGDPKTNARQRECVPGSGEPVDVATGQMYMGATDVRLPGALALVLERMHYSEYRAGRLFGASWASTLDQRLEFENDGVYFAGANGERLIYPHPADDGAAMFAKEGPRWPLARTADGFEVRLPSGVCLGFPRSQTVAPLAYIADPNGNRIDVDYDAGGPVRLRHSGGHTVSIDTEAGLITQLRLGDIELIRYRYNERRQLTEVINSSGLPMMFDYDTDGRITRWQDRNGQWYEYHYDELGRVVRTEGAGGAIVGTWSYDSVNRVTVYTDSLGNPWEYHRNEREQVVREVSPLGGVVLSEWDRYNRLLSRTDALGNTSRWEYDDSGNVVAVTQPDGSTQTAEYGPFGKATTLRNAEGAVWRQEYDERGNLIAAVDPLGGVERYSRDERGNLRAVTDAVGRVRRFETNAAGLAVAVTDETGATTRYQRDVLGRVAAVTDPAGGVTRFGWTVEGMQSWVTTPGGATERWQYDAEQNEVGHIDALGNVTRTTRTYFDRIAGQIKPDGSHLHYDYDSEMRLVAVTDARGLVWRYTYDADGNLIHEKDYNGAEIHYVYDAAGWLTERTNAMGQTTRYTRDQAGRVVERDAAGEVTSARHDSQGRVVWTRNSDAQVEMEYDLLGRLVRETVNGRSVTSAYDPAGRRRERRTSAGAVCTWDYGLSDRPVALHTGGQAVGFGYDAAGREIKRMVSGLAMTRIWDSDYRLRTQAVTVRQAGQRGADLLLQRRSYAYRQDGALRSVVDQLAGAREFDLDAPGRVNAVRGAAGEERYAYDVSGNVVEALWPTGDEVRGKREYDATLAHAAGQVRYSYDRQGRLLLRQKKRLSAKPASWRFTWDAEDRLRTAVTPDGTEWRYRYDPFGRRVAKEKLSADSQQVVERVDFAWDGAALAEQSVHRQGEATARVTTWDYEPGTVVPLAQTERTSSADTPQEWFDEQFYAIITDLVGAPTELVDATGRIVWRHTATIWGLALTNATSAARTPLRFPGQYFDEESGLHYNVLRYYDPEQGRYTSADPLGLVGGPNPHTYVPNPLQWTDFLGLTPNRGGTCPWAPTHRELTAQLRGTPQNSHHVIQDAAVRDLPGYNSRDAPTVSLEGPSTRREGHPDGSTEHGRATGVQDSREGRGTYGAERDVAYRALVAAGYTPERAAAEIARADRYFMEHLGVTLDTPTRVPGTRGT